MLREADRSGRPTMTVFMWAVVAGRGHSSEQLGRSFTEDLDDAKARVNEHAERLRREGRTDWIGSSWTWIGRS